MKIKNSIIFLAVFLLLLTGFSALFLPKANTIEAGVDERDYRAYGVFDEPEHTIDTVVLGDSLSYTGINPLEMWEEEGTAAYLCGRTAQRMPEAYYMLKRILKSQSPRLVILETNMLLWPEDKAGQINQALFEGASYYLPVFEYHNQWKRLNRDASDEAETEMGKNYKGFYSKTDCIPYGGGEYMVETMTAREIAKTERFFLGQMIRMCRAKGIEFLMVSVPSPADYRYECHNAFEILAKEHDVNYLDMNLLTDEIGIDWNADILDGAEHLNVFGAEKVSSYLADYIAEKYDMPDHRGEAAYEAWDEEYDNYRKDIRKAGGK